MVAYVRGGELAPGRVSSLLANQCHEVKLRVEAVGLGTRVREETLLVQLLRDLRNTSAAASKRATDAYVKHFLGAHAQQTRSRLL